VIKLDKLYIPFHLRFDSVFARNELKKSSETNNLEQLVDRSDVLKFYRAAKKVLKVLNELTKLQMCTEEGQKNLETLRLAISPSSIEEQEQEEKPEVSPEPTPSVTLNILEPNSFLSSKKVNQ
jgi:hypothetical protein